MSEEAGAAVAEPEVAAMPRLAGDEAAGRRFAVFSDVHGNLPALRACLDDMDPDNLPVRYCCGDLVGYGAYPNECVDLLLGAPGTTTVLGNHDQMALALNNLAAFNEAARRAIAWTARTLTPESRGRLGTLPLVHHAHACTFVHGSPFDPAQWHYVLTRRAAQYSFRHFGSWICFIGHSHQPFVVEQTATRFENGGSRWDADDGGGHEAGAGWSRAVWYGGARLLGCEPGEVALDPACRYLINVGSVGQPRDLDPRACYVTVDLDAMRLRFHRVEYDVAEAQRAIVDAGLPVELARRLARGR